MFQLHTRGEPGSSHASGRSRDRFRYLHGPTIPALLTSRLATGIHIWAKLAEPLGGVDASAYRAKVPIASAPISIANRNPSHSPTNGPLVRWTMIHVPSTSGAAPTTA